MTILRTCLLHTTNAWVLFEVYEVSSSKANQLNETSYKKVTKILINGKLSSNIKILWRIMNAKYEIGF